MTKWDKRFFDECDLKASWSEDLSRKVGAVIVGLAHEPRSAGWNGLPRGVKSLPERQSRDNGEKYHWFSHAEENAIANAARVGIPLEGSTMYSNLFPCSTCSRLIIQSGIKTLCTYEIPENEKNFGRSMEVALTMMKEAGIQIKWFTKSNK